MLAVAEINPAVNKLPPVMLAELVIVLVAEINPPVRILPLVMLAVAEINPPVRILPLVMLAVAEINPVTNKFAPE